jgi:hypothetical protein
VRLVHANLHTNDTFAEAEDQSQKRAQDYHNRDVGVARTTKGVQDQRKTQVGIVSVENTVVSKEELDENGPYPLQPTSLVGQGDLPIDDDDDHSLPNDSSKLSSGSKSSNSPWSENDSKYKLIRSKPLNNPFKYGLMSLSVPNTLSMGSGDEELNLSCELYVSSP